MDDHTCACSTRSHERRCHQQKKCCWWPAMHGVFLYHGSLNGGKTRWQLRSAHVAAACFRNPIELVLTTHVEAWTGTGSAHASKYGSCFDVSPPWGATCFATVCDCSSVPQQTANSSHHRHFLGSGVFDLSALDLAPFLVVFFGFRVCVGHVGDCSLLQFPSSVFGSVRSLPPQFFQWSSGAAFWSCHGL